MKDHPPGRKPDDEVRTTLSYRQPTKVGLPPRLKVRRCQVQQVIAGRRILTVPHGEDIQLGLLTLVSDEAGAKGVIDAVRVDVTEVTDDGVPGSVEILFEV
ncbi:hypothetical protein LCGC14_1599420 [marine sediment metagenome]|uniref:Uncharacterized protein n=1 Tax=marine sediment metagenome TaxID=412755 RepID=A0A0F9LBN5_9ZZZZ